MDFLDFDIDANVSPPIIDISCLLEGSNSESVACTVSKIGNACRRWGFFQIINHGIGEDVLQLLDLEMTNFFGCPLGVKNQIRRQSNNSRGYTDSELTKQKLDMKQIFDVGHKPCPHLSDRAPENVVMDGYNQWPSEEDLPGFRPAVETAYDHFSKLSLVLLSAMAKDLGLSPSYFDDFFLKHTSFLRLNYYPPVDPEEHGQKLDEEQLGVSRHTDAGALTILMQDYCLTSGLEVYSGCKQDMCDGFWVPVKPVPGALTINTGDMMQVWSNGAYKAPEHRVRASASVPLHSPSSRTPGSCKSARIGRYSAPFFFNPGYDEIVAPIPTPNATISGESDVFNPKYKGILWGDFRQGRFQGDFADRGREIQIEDFKIPVTV